MQPQPGLTTQEGLRTDDLLALIPRNRASILDVGARDGRISRLLTRYFEEVTALDLQKPRWEYPRIKTTEGNVTNLPFPDNSFDCVFCAEVLEHVRDLERACHELVRVARHELLIGVPYKQDIRVGQMTCSHCGRINPPWGHVNSFDERKLMRLFSGARLLKKSFVGSTRDRTNQLAAFLMQLGGNPWGPYNQEEPCIYCGQKLIAPAKRTVLQKVFSKTAAQINAVEIAFSQPRPNWIHVLFAKE